MKELIKIVAAAALLALSTPLEAQVFNTLIRDVDPAAAGIAGASVAQKANAYALDNNPAAMSFSADKISLAAGYAILQPSSVKMGTLSFSSLFKLSEKLALGASIKRGAYNPYPITSEEGRSTTEYTPSELSLSLGGSYLILKGLSAGVKLNYASIGLSPDAKYNVFSGDLGITYATESLTVAANARNLGSQVMDLRAGASYTLSFLTAYAQGEYLAGAGMMGALGLQYSFKDILFVRAGGHLGNAEKAIPSYASLGLGAKIKGITFDAAALLGTRSETGTLLFSAGYSF